mmetsp:Transcript_16458/g.27935  ORF Transcript_16458/g.27935 Transcript_16458/m.27935 type:complete len:97 (-) Transcript_16458:200-490(-)
MLALDSGLQEPQMLYLQSQPDFLAGPEFSFEADLLQNLSKDCTIDEARNRRGPNKCYNSNECHGDRYCSSYGWCNGNNNCTPNDKPAYMRDCSINE